MAYVFLSGLPAGFPVSETAEQVLAALHWDREIPFRGPIDLHTSEGTCMTVLGGRVAVVLADEADD
jgi:hypothetical protein